MSTLLRRTGWLFIVMTFVFNQFSARAALVTFTFSGRVSDVDDSNGILNGEILQGDSMLGSFTFETTTSDGNPDTTQGSYDALTDWHVDLQGDEFDLFDLSSIFVQDLSTDDIYQVFARMSAPLGDGIWNAIWIFNDPTGNLVSSDALPDQPPDIIPWQTPPSVVQISDEEATISLNLDFFGMLGDMDCDRDTDFDDIDEFVLGLRAPDIYFANIGVLPEFKGDIDRDGDLDFDDIPGFVGILTENLGAGLTSVPEPSALFLSMMGLLTMAAFTGRQRRKS